MKNVFDCLIALQTQFRPQDGACNNLNAHASNLSGNVIMTRWKSMVEHYGRDDAQREESSRFRPFSSFREERPKSDLKSQRGSSRSPVMAGTVGRLT